MVEESRRRGNKIIVKKQSNNTDKKQKNHYILSLKPPLKVEQKTLKKTTLEPTVNQIVIK